jgi:hypothetical protein
MNKKPNWSLIIALALPILMMIGVALSIYVPSLFQTYHGQFLYSVQEIGSWGIGRGFVVVNGKIQPQPAVVSAHTVYSSTTTARLYVHDLATNESRDISLEEAQRLNLDPSPRSPEGVEIDYGSQTDGVFPFFMISRDDYSAVYAKGERASRKLNVRIKPGGYYNQFQFQGWIKS